MGHVIELEALNVGGRCRKVRAKVAAPVLWCGLGSVAVASLGPIHARRSYTFTFSDFALAAPVSSWSGQASESRQEVRL
jgi:hypothetical protein